MRPSVPSPPPAKKGGGGREKRLREMVEMGQDRKEGEGGTGRGGGGRGCYTSITSGIFFLTGSHTRHLPFSREHPFLLHERNTRMKDRKTQGERRYRFRTGQCEGKGRDENNLLTVEDPPPPTHPKKRPYLAFRLVSFIIGVGIAEISTRETRQGAAGFLPRTN